MVQSDLNRQGTIGQDKQKNFSYNYPPVLTFVLGAQKNHLIETVLLSTNNMFWLGNMKNDFHYLYMQSYLEV